MVNTVKFAQIAPVFPVVDLERSISHYEALGFEVAKYDGDEDYAYAKLGAVRIHLWQAPGIDPETNFSAAFIEVDDADARALQWKAVSDNAEIRCPTGMPVDTEYGLREGAHVDPDGNLMRFAHKLT
ncbi:bleomycin resistance protein [Renibacterium salmoninarum]|nr:VOC family protein [Renibacterium salmoninarum]